MRLLTVTCLALCFLSNPAFAQQDPPVWESYLSRLTVYHERDDSLTVDLLFKKEGGPVKHTQQQMYILIYLTMDEAKIHELATNPALLDKRDPDKPMLIDVLLEKKLIAILDSKVGDFSSKAAQDAIGSYGLESDDLHSVASLRLNTIPYKFTFSNKSLFEAASKLGNFDASKTLESSSLWFEDMFKLIAFVPVNDCKYADKITPERNQKYDFANLPSNKGISGDEFLCDRTPLLYFKSLPYEFQFVKGKGDRYMIYIN